MSLQWTYRSLTENVFWREIYDSFFSYIFLLRMSEAICFVIDVGDSASQQPTGGDSFLKAALGYLIYEFCYINNLIYEVGISLSYLFQAILLFNIVNLILHRLY